MDRGCGDLGRRRGDLERERSTGRLRPSSLPSFIAGLALSCSSWRCSLRARFSSFRSAFLRRFSSFSRARCSSFGSDFMAAPSFVEAEGEASAALLAVGLDVDAVVFLAGSNPLR